MDPVCHEDRNKMLKDEHSRDIVLDVAKGVLIILMVVGHSGAPKWLENCIYSFHMPCFFIISGILFSYAYLHKPAKFVKKRIKTIWWPFVKWTWIFLILHNLFSNAGLYSESYSLQMILKKIFTVFFLLDIEQLLGGFWFLISLFFASMVCFIYYKLAGTNRLSLILGIAGFVALAEIFTIMNFKFHYFNSGNFLACAYFITGTLFNSINYNKIFSRNFIIITGMILFAVSGIGEKLEMTRLSSVNLVPYFVSSVLISWGFLMIIENYQYKTWIKYLCYVGVRTMDILLLHFLAFKVASLLKIQIYGLDISELSKFPVITENNSVFWIVYVILALIICLSYSKIKEYIQGWFLYFSNKKDKMSVL